MENFQWASITKKDIEVCLWSELLCVCLWQIRWLDAGGDFIWCQSPHLGSDQGSPGRCPHRNIVSDLKHYSSRERRHPDNRVNQRLMLMLRQTLIKLMLIKILLADIVLDLSRARLPNGVNQSPKQQHYYEISNGPICFLSAICHNCDVCNMNNSRIVISPTWQQAVCWCD